MYILLKRLNTRIKIHISFKFHKECSLFHCFSVLIKVPDHEMSGDGLGDNNDADNDDDSDFDIDETDLESYSTVLEANEDIDEFQIFCQSLQSRLLKI